MGHAPEQSWQRIIIQIARRRSKIPRLSLKAREEGGRLKERWGLSFKFTMAMLMALSGIVWLLMYPEKACGSAGQIICNGRFHYREHDSWLGYRNHHYADYHTAFDAIGFANSLRMRHNFATTGICGVIDIASMQFNLMNGIGKKVSKLGCRVSQGQCMSWNNESIIL